MPYFGSGVSAWGVSVTTVMRKDQKQKVPYVEIGLVAKSWVGEGHQQQGDVVSALYILKEDSRWDREGVRVWPQARPGRRLS